MAGDYSDSNHELTWEGAQTQGGEILFTGSNSYIVIPDSADWVLSGAFTLEIFGARFDNNTARHSFFTQWASGVRSFLFRFEGDSTPKALALFISTDGSGSFQSVSSPEWEPTVDTPYDITYERDGSDNFRIYVDGSMIHKETFTHTPHNSSTDVILGAQDPPSPSNPWAGGVKAYRFTNGVARYADDDGYTVPELPLPTSGA